MNNMIVENEFNTISEALHNLDKVGLQMSDSPMFCLCSWYTGQPFQLSKTEATKEDT